MKDIILKAEKISYHIENKKLFSNNQTTEILKDVSFEIKRGKVLGISGQSGSGKSTLAKILSRVYFQTSGTIHNYFVKDWSDSLSNPVQILFQNDGELINPFRKVKDVLNEAFELKFKKDRNYESEVDEIIKKFNLNPSLKESKGSQLSGGEKQRIALARIVIVEPEILVLDEPFSSQDVEAQLSIIKLINKLKSEHNLTIICISHDLNILKHISDELIIMFNGKVVEYGETKALIDKPTNEYTRFLLRAQALNLTEEEIQEFHNTYEQN